MESVNDESVEIFKKIFQTDYGSLWTPVCYLKNVSLSHKIYVLGFYSSCFFVTKIQANKTKSKITKLTKS